MNTLKQQIKDTANLMRSVPSTVMIFFCMSVFLMNLLANKEIGLNLTWLALDCGFTLSWLSFLCMDMLTKRFGPTAAIKLSIVSVMFSLFGCGVFKVVSIIPGNWGEYYTYGDTIVNDALNSTIGGTWYVVAGSMLAFLVSSIINAVVNHGVGRLMKKDNFVSYALRSYVSTMLAQFFDNLIFALVVSYHFFGWSLVQCVTCAITGCVAELLCEVIFSPIGYKVCKKWEEEKVGVEYLNGGHSHEI